MSFLVLSLVALSVASTANALTIRRPIRTIDVRAAAIPSGWAKGSCVVDSASTRALGAYHTTTSTNTPANCINTCISQGYSVAGLEYGQECWCGNSIAKSGSVGSTASSSDCSMACSGDSTQECGNGNRLQIYQKTASTPTIPSGWTKSSCIVDSTSPRALGSFHTTSSSNTPANCINTCIAQGYSIAGLEFGQECWCSNSILKSGTVGSTASSSDCSMACSGDSSQECGNGNRLQIYETSGATSTTSSSSSSTTSRTTSTTSTTTRSSTTSRTTSTTTTTSAATTIPTGWTKSSCIVDSTSTRALGAYHTSSSTNTPANCINTCNSQGYSYAGLEYGQECWCANSINVSGSIGTVASSGDCSKACSGDPSQMCGNGNRLQIYVKAGSSSTTSRTSSSTTTRSTSTSTTTTTTSSSATSSASGSPTLPSGWTKTSCVVDSTGTRALGNYHTLTGTNTPVNCIDTCSAQGFSYAGTEFGEECWCGYGLTISGSVGTVAASSDCSMACSGDPSQTCGAGNRLQVYSKPAGTSGGVDYGLGPKVGIAWGADNSLLKNWKTPSVGTMYNWSEDCPTASELDGMDCYPMLWGWSNADAFQAKVVEGYGKVALCINEPNEPGQANLSPQDGVTLFKQYCQPLKQKGYKLCSPATSSNPNGYTWMQQFYELCGEDQCEVDFTCIHWYDQGLAKFQTYVNQWHDGFGRPIMITEFADQNNNGGAQDSCPACQTFLEQATAWLDTVDWVLKYFWFGALPSMSGVNQCDSLWNNGSPNALGKIYIKE